MIGNIFLRLVITLAVASCCWSASFQSRGQMYLQNVAYPTKCLSQADNTQSTLTIVDCFADFPPAGSSYQGPQLFNIVYSTGDDPTEHWWMLTIRSLTLSLNTLTVTGGTGNGAAVGMADLYTSGDTGPLYQPTPQQKWTLQGNYNDNFQIQSKYSGRCLTAEGVGGTSIDQWDCWGQPHQQWRNVYMPVVPAPLGYLLKSVAYGSCLDGGANSDGADYYQWPCVPQALNHRWTLNPQPSGVYVVNQLTSKCMQVNNGGTTDESRVTQHGCPYVEFFNYEWTLTKDTSFPRRTRFEHFNAPGMCLTVESTGVGGYTDIWECSTAPHQNFYLVTPAQYLLTYGNACTSDLACLSGSCLVTCQKGATGKPCQQYTDCSSGTCNYGVCT